jgi:VanZ family protein
MKKEKKIIFSLALWYIITILLLLAPPSWLGPIPIQKVDKLSHILLFFTGTYIACKIISIKDCLVLMMLLSLGSELIQALSPNRTLSLNDLLANTIGISLAIVLAVILNRPERLKLTKKS